MKSPYRVLGHSAKHVVLLAQRPARSVMRRHRCLWQADSNTPSRPLHTTTLLSREWTITPPRPPSAHPLSPSTTTTPTSTEPKHPNPLSHQLHTLMRLLSHSVVVCTSTTPPGPHHRTPTPRAMTMSSFTSLALTPTPVVSFNIATPSRTFDAVEASRRFNIHVLTDDVDGARVADWLSMGNAGGKKVFDGLAEECGCEMEMGEGLGVEESPVLKGPGVLCVLRCELLEEPSGGLVRVRDHVIVLGEVVEILHGHDHHGHGSGKGKRHEEKFGLLYADRRYRQLGNCITPVKGHG